MKKRNRSQMGGTLTKKMVRKITPILGGCFIVLIAFVGILSYLSLSRTMKREFNNMADGNASRIQSGLDEAILVSKNMQSYLVSEYDQAAEQTDKEKQKKTGTSIVTGKKMNGDALEAEKYLVREGWAIVNNSENIMGVGGNFEPYKLDKNSDSYAFYINEENAKNEEAPSLGDYENYCNEVYYQIAKEKMLPYFTEPYEFEGIKRVICSFPIVYHSEFQGAITANIKLDRFRDFVKTNDSYPSMYSSILTQDAVYVYDTQSEDYIGKSLIEDLDASGKKIVQEGMAKGEQFDCTARDGGDTTYLVFVPISAGSNTWWALTAVEAGDMNRNLWGTIGFMIFLAIIILFLVSIAIIKFLHAILSPLKDIAAAADSIAGGQLEISLTADTDDEIGRITQAFSHMADNLKMVIEDTSYGLMEMANGNFTVSIQHPEAFVGEYIEIMKAARMINERLSAVLVQINQSADQVAGGSSHVAGASQSLSEGAADQAAAIDGLAGTISDISEHTKSNADHAKEASNRMELVGQKAEESSRKMGDMLTAISDISESSREIEKIIRTIEDIATQTNLLSLNAAIEAARAGDAGKGFAVVAEEVRELAEKSAEASRDTAALIETALRAVEHGTSIADETAQALTVVVQGVEEITESMERIASASDVQADSINHVTKGIDQIADVVQSNSATAQESAAASEELSSLSQVLKELVNKFQLKS